MLLFINLPFPNRFLDAYILSLILLFLCIEVSFLPSSFQFLNYKLGSYYLRIKFDIISITKQNAESKSPTPRIVNAGVKSVKVRALFPVSSGLSTRHWSVSLKYRSCKWTMKPLAHIRSTALKLTTIKNFDTQTMFMQKVLGISCSVWASKRYCNLISYCWVSQ